LAYFAYVIDDCAREIDWGIMDLSWWTDYVFKTRCRVHPSSENTPLNVWRRRAWKLQSHFGAFRDIVIHIYVPTL